ncbi:MAG: hypothetical protein IKQ41_13435 [Clostridia bacterium]|nr:hypothetical protein [Clostridia bacterium]
MGQQAAMHFRCPACGSSLTFSSQSQNLKCDSCKNEFTLETLEQVAQNQIENTPDQSLHWGASGNQGFGAEEASRLRSFRCQNCGSEIFADETTAATECVYCGSPSILPGVLSGAYRPDRVIPFKKSRQEAQDAFRGHCKGKKLLPKGFFDEGRVEKITGVYVPFWLYQADAEADCTYKATKVSRSRHGDYVTTRTAHFLVRRGGHIGFSEVPVDGASAMDDTMMESIEPFHTGDAQPFSSAYLSGYQAQRYDVDQETCQPRANDRIRESVKSYLRSSVSGYASVVPDGVQIQLQNSQVSQVLFPVWMLNTRWREKTYTFAMNGQTGRFIGDLPVDKGKFWGWLLGLTLGIGFGGFAAAYALFSSGVL